MVKAKSILLSFLLLVPTYLWASPKLSVEVDPPAGNIDDEYLMSVQVETQDSVNYPTVEESSDFKVSLIGPEQRVEIINGEVSKSITFRYKLIPKKKGQLVTPKVSVKVDGQELSNSGVSVAIGQGASSTTSTPGIELQQHLNKSSAYVGEQVTYSMELGSQLQVRQAEPNFPSLTDFWAQDYEDSKRLQRGLQVAGMANGRPKFRKALFPLKTGVLNIPAGHAKVLVPKARKQGRGFGGFDSDPFDIFNRHSPFGSSILDEFLGQDFTQKELSSEPIELSVKELPKQPDGDFWTPSQPIVGETRIRLDYSPDPIKLGESKTIDVNISSFGNLNPIDAIPLELPSSVNKYDDFPQNEVEERDNKLLTTKRFKISLVPQDPGKLVVPPLKLLYFDPEAGEYKYAQSNPVEIEVTGQKTSSNTFIAPTPTLTHRPESVATSPTPSVTPPPSPEPQLTYQEPTWWQSVLAQVGWKMITFVLFLLASVGGIIAGLIQRSKSLVPLRQAQIALEQAETLDALSENFRLWLIRKNNLDSFDLEAIKAKTSDNQLIFTITDIFDQINFLNFSGNKPEINQINSIKNRILDLIRKI